MDLSVYRVKNILAPSLSIIVTGDGSQPSLWLALAGHGEGNCGAESAESKR